MGKNKTTIIVVVLILASFVIYSMFFKKDANSAQTIVGVGASEHVVNDREIIVLLDSLKSINLDATFFQTKTFTSLTDFSIPIDPEPTGRNNPFAAIDTGDVVESEANSALNAELNEILQD